MKLRHFLLFVLILTISVVLMTGCGSTRQASYADNGVGSDDDLSDIDQLLGLGDFGADEEGQAESVEEDEILRLLGVLEEGDASASFAEEQSAASSGDLSSQVRQLENQQSSLDAQMDNLARDLNQQSQTISQVNSQPQSSTIPATSSSTPAWKSSDFKSQYQEALQAYRGRQYRNAVQKFEALLNVNARHSLSDNCQYWIGESYYGLGDYQQAIVAFEKVFAFTNSNKDDDAQLKLGLCYLKLNDQARARTEFEKLVNSYPTSEYVSIAKRYLTSL